MINIIGNIILSSTLAVVNLIAGIVTSGLKMWLPFEKSERLGGTQISPDKSGNSNNATLYTGKCLEFNGSTDYVDLGLQSNPATNMTFACWLNPVISASSSNQSIIDYGKFNVWLNDNDTLVVYTNTGGAGVNYTISDLNNKWSRLVVSVSGTTTSVYIDGTFIQSKTTTALSGTANTSVIGREGTTKYYKGKLSDLQIWDIAWAQADVTFDYNNPQHLVTDNSASSIALSNLKGYWHLSEGNGNVAFNSGVPLGSELIPDGDFPLGTTEWSSSTGAGTFGDGYFRFTNTGRGGTDLTSNNTDPIPDSTSIILFTYTIYDVAAGDAIGMRVKEPIGSVAISRPPTSGIRIDANGTYTFIYTGGGASNRPTFEVFPSSDNFKLTNVSAKVISAGKILGSSWETAESTMPQLGMMDWNKLSNLNYYLLSPLTQNSNIDVTLISNPNDPSKDITGNLVRLREHSLNLDGSGYAEVADSTSINPTDAITVECWVYWDASSDSGLVAKWTSGINQDYMLYKQSATKFDFYIGAQNKRCNTALSNGWNYIVGTYDKTHMKVYLNGDLDATLAHTSAIPNTVQVLEIGRYNNQASFSYSERIDDARLYGIALSAEEVEQNYNAGLPAHTPLSSFSNDFSSDYGL